MYSCISLWLSTLNRLIMTLFTESEMGLTHRVDNLDNKGYTTLHKLTSCNSSRVTVEGKSSACLICMKYGIIILIIIIISLGEIILAYIANTSRTHAHARMHTHRRLHSGSMGRRRQSVTQLTPLFTCSAGIHGR